MMEWLRCLYLTIIGLSSLLSLVVKIVTELIKKWIQTHNPLKTSLALFQLCYLKMTRGLINPLSDYYIYLMERVSEGWQPGL